MEVQLPSGHTAQFRDQLMRGDIREARRGMVFVTAPDGSRRVDGAFLDDLKGSVITRMMYEWTWAQSGLPLPQNAGRGEQAQQILDKLPEDDFAALEDAVQPWVDRILRMNRALYRYSHTATGVVVEVQDEAEAQKLAASGEFTAVEGGDPKRNATPALPPTGTSSPESPALTGPEPTTDPTPAT